MQKVGLMVGLALVAIACATGADMIDEIMDSGVPDAGAESPGDGTTMQYVGNSTETFRGDRELYDESGSVLEDEYGNQVQTGIFEEYAACQETFGPGNRTCTSDEIRFTTDIPKLSGYAWVNPGSGCTGTFNEGGRAAVSETGQFVQMPCFVEGTMQKDPIVLPVACCGPK